MFVPHDGRRSDHRNPEDKKIGKTKIRGNQETRVFSLIGSTRVFSLISFCISLTHDIRFDPGISLVDPNDAAGHQPLPVKPPWLIWVPRGRLSWWQRLWGPKQSWTIYLQSLRPVSRRSMRMGWPCPWRRAWAGESTPSWIRLRRGWTLSPDWSG